MPEITFFEPAHSRPIIERYQGKKEYKRSVMLGDYRFFVKKTELVKSIVGNGLYDVIGYNVTYENIFITQEETDKLMERFKKETGQ